MSRVPLFLSLAALAALLASSGAEANDALMAKTYHFGTHEARTNVTFVSEADLETIHGVTHKMSGSVTIDTSGKKGKGSLRVGVRTLQTGIALRDEHLRSAQWLDAARYPWIRLELTSLTEDEGGKTWSWKGSLNVKGRSKEISGKAKVKPIPAQLGKQLGAGSWVRVRTGFEVKLADHGIVIPQKVGAKVSAVWQVKVDLYGTTAAPRR